MAGEIKHKWHGTVLTITSDAGTSSADLKGEQGAEGIRGPQGRCGLILNPDGTVDYGGYATEEYVDYRIETLGREEPDLSNYYTKDEIDATLAEYQPSGGGGGGGASNNAVLTITNTAGWLSKTIPQGADCYISASWNSLEGGLETGGGALTIYVGGIVKYTANVEQGPISVNVAPYLSTGKCSVRVSIMDVYGNIKSIVYTINSVALQLTSTFDATVPYSGDINFTYTPFGSVEKKMYFVVDGEVIGTEEVYTSGRQRTFMIPAQSHGSHTLKVYYESPIDGQDIPSNVLYYDLICTEEGNETPIIASAFNKTTMAQFETINIYYSVYTPNSLSSNITLAHNGIAINNLTVDRTQQLWSYRAETSGDVELTITCGDQVKRFAITVAESAINVEAETNNLDLYLSSYGRSNSEDFPASWMYGDVECRFVNYNWVSDGWVPDNEKLIVHRVIGDARLTIPLNVFSTASQETGKTIEIEFATRDIMDYDATIVSCMQGGIGFEMTPQKAILKSEQSEIFTQYKENEHIRLTFVIEKKSENRLIYTYLNGIMCGAVQYPENDNFAQGDPVGITIGSNFAGIDIYTIRVYSNNLTRYQVLDNWIADTQNIEEKLKRYERNRIYDAYGSIVTSNLPAGLPYLTLEARALPEFKGNKLTVDGSYIDPLNANKCFTFKSAMADVQGTSSAGYARKNYIINFPADYKLRDDSIPTDTFTFKADVASSEGANNVELVRLYNNICPYKTPPQLEDARVRQGIDGFPIVIFHNDGNKTEFIGKYNFNNDKKTPEVFGFAGYDQSWEIRNNTSNRVLWKSADFEGTDWLNDFEGRYPKDCTNPEKLAHFAAWVASTDRTGLDEAEAAARLAKFKAEVQDYAVLDSALFYYLFTELFLMVDSRAKNAFPTWFEGEDKVVWLPYDMDTALGINNEGALTFGYELEDIDQTESGADVYNGQQSVFWCNLRDAFGDELRTMYQKLRSDKVLSYDIVEQMFEEHQKVWPEAIWNEDAWYKYLQPLVEDNTASYLSMLQGSKEEQRKWWLYNRFRYMDAKYNAGDAQKDFITLRGYEKSDITVEPYADIYASVKYGSYLTQKRALRGDTYTLECPIDTLNDTEIYIYSASQLRSIGDLSGLKVGYADFSMGTKLQDLKVGSADEGYSNENLTELYLGNNTLLRTLDVRNCPNLTQSITLSGCTNIEHIYFDGTAIKGCSLPNGGILKTLHLPSTITNLTLLNQRALTDLSIPSYENVTTLRLENVGDKVDIFTILGQMKPNSRVRLINVDWTFDKAEDVETFYNFLDTMRGLDENNNNMPTAQISGRIHVPIITNQELESLRSRYKTMNITYDTLGFCVQYVNYNNTLLYSYIAPQGSATIDPIEEELIPVPTKPQTTSTTYVFEGWSNMTSNIQKDLIVVANYTAETRKYAVRFYNNGTLLQTVMTPYGSGAAYTGAEPDDGVNGTTFAGFFPNPTNVTGDMSCQALYYSINAASNEITDSWNTIIASIADGTYASKYGKYCYKYEGDQVFVLASCYKDELPNGGRAAMTWVELKYPKYRGTWTNVANSTNGGWANSEVRRRMSEELLPLLPTVLQDNILEVVKTHEGGSSTIDRLWAPSKAEVEANGLYGLSSTFRNLIADGERATWWLRDCSDGTAKAINGYGTTINSDVDNVQYYVSGFCL